MNISDLNHLEPISEAPNVAGGWLFRSYFHEFFFIGYFRNCSWNSWDSNDSENSSSDEGSFAEAIVTRIDGRTTASAFAKSGSSFSTASSVSEGAIAMAESGPGFARAYSCSGSTCI